MPSPLTELLQAYNESVVATKAEDNQQFLVFSTKRHGIYQGPGFVGGLADRLKGLVTTFYLAVLTNRRFVIHWEDPLPLVENLLPRRYDWRLQFAQRFLNSSNVIKQIDLIDRSELIDETPPEKIESELFAGDKVVMMNINSLRLKAIRTAIEEKIGTPVSPSQLYQVAFDFLFSFVERDETTDQRTNMNAVRAESDLFVVAHLRTGAGNSWKDPVLDDWKNYRAVLERAFDEATARNATRPAFWFLSDSQQAREAVLEDAWPHPVHTDQAEISHMDRSKDAGVLSHHQTFLEFELIKKSNLVVCGEGGFAVMAAQAGGIPVVKYKS